MYSRAEGKMQMAQTTKQVLAQQQADAARDRQQKQKPQPQSPAGKPAAQPAAAKPAPQSTAVAPRPATTLPAAPDTRTNVQRYLDEVAPSMIVGQLLKFSKEGKFVVTGTEEEIGPDEDFTVLADQTLAGHTKFSQDGEPPERMMGLLYEGFVVTPEAELPDRDQSQWPIGLSGKEEDPWKHMIYLVLERCTTHELYTFVTQSKSGRRSVGTLLRHYDRMRKNYPGEYPVVKLKTGGFQPRDQRLPWTYVPVFVAVGRAPVDSTAKPDTSLRGEMDDEIPW
jgi:hypothetical protein